MVLILVTSLFWSLLYCTENNEASSRQFELNIKTAGVLFMCNVFVRIQDKSGKRIDHMNFNKRHVYCNDKEKKCKN